MSSPDEDAFSPSDLAAERARLDAELLADAVRLNELDRAEGNLKIERVRLRIRFGTNLDRRLEITPRGQKGIYIRKMARAWRFEWRKAHDNRIFARVHQADPGRFDFAGLAKMTIPEVCDEYRRLGGNEAAAGGLVPFVARNLAPTSLFNAPRCSLSVVLLGAHALLAQPPTD